MKFVAFYLFLSFLCVPLAASAQTTIKQTQVGSRSGQHKVWKLTQEEWSRYESIMDSKGKYFWSDLDPITVLGLNARNEQERRRFAQMLARQEYENTRKLILLDRAFNKAFQQLYGSIPIVDLNRLNIASAKASLTPASTKYRGEPGDRWIVFASTRCPSCDKRIRSILDNINLGVSVDIHFKNDPRSAITAWASRMQISPKSVEAGTITLNPNSELYDKFGDPSPPSVFFFDKALNQVKEVRDAP